MITKDAYTRPIPSGCMYLLRFPGIFIIVLSFILSINDISGQEEPQFDEILISAEIPGLGVFELPAVISGSNIYLSVTDLFDFLKVRNIASPGLDSISGFFINHEATYLINYPESKIRFQDRIYTVIKGDLIRTESNLYLKTDYLGRIFGLDCSFNFRSLSVTINSKLELPVIREMRLEEMRKNLTRLKGETEADTSIGRTHPFFRLGMADWAITGSEEINGRTDATGSLSLGAMLAGGEATATMYYNSRGKFSEKQQYYLWRYVDNDFKPLRQVAAGKIFTQAISTLYSPVIGFQLTNTPTTFRRSFGSYKLSDYTDPGWIVELYVNNVLVDYVKADASGFYTFDVPMVYGNSSVKLKFYGPWGEERTKEQNTNVPYNFLPSKTLEYNIGAGIVEDTSFSRFSRVNINYGLSRHITIGGGMEYLSSVTSGPIMPFVTSSFRVTNNLLLSGEYTYGVRAKGIMVYRLPSNLQLDLNYTWYERGQTAIDYTYLEERKAALSLPLRLGKLSTYQRLSVYQIILPGSNYTTAEWLFSGSLFGVNTNFTTFALFIGESTPSVYSNLSLAFRLPAKITVMPQFQYSYTQSMLVTGKLRIEKMIGSKAFLNLQYERNFLNNLNLAELGFRYDFSFAQIGASVMQSNKRTTLVQYARGSLIADSKTGYLTADNRTNVGKGGITIAAYLDINGNRGRDPGEPRAKGLNIRANGGRIIINENDTTIRIFGLEPYTNCFIELNSDGFESVSWRLPVKTLNVAVDPDILKLVEIPVSVVGEASGTVRVDEDGQINGIGRILINFYNQFNERAGRTLSESDGTYFYSGLVAGEYIVQPDTAQLRKLNMHSSPVNRKFAIIAGKEGDFVSDLDFVLMKNRPDTTAVKAGKPTIDTLKPVIKPPKLAVIPVLPAVRKDTTYMVVHEVTEQLITTGEEGFAIQLGAFRRKSNAEAFRKKLEGMVGKKVDIIIENDLYKVRITGMKERKEADEAIAILQKNGITELWLITIKAQQKQWMLIDKTDTIAKITEVVAGGEIPVVTPDLAIQIGAFRQKSLANAMYKKISKMISQPVIIVAEDGYYKVRVRGFRNLDELQKMVPVLRAMGLTDIWVPPVKIEPEIVKPVVRPADTAVVKPGVIVPPVVRPPVAIGRDTALAKVDTAMIKVDTALVKADTTVIKPVEVPVTEVQPPVEKVKISLHVGEFRKRSQALRAQKKVESKFGLPVDIFMRWDSYHIVITGFEKREDTFIYYPDLAGMGYTNIYVIQQK